MVTNYLTFTIQERKTIFDQFWLQFSIVDHFQSIRFRSFFYNSEFLNYAQKWLILVKKLNICLFVSFISISKLIFLFKNSFSLGFCNFSFNHINKSIKNLNFHKILFLIIILTKFVKNIFFSLNIKSQVVCNQKLTLVYSNIAKLKFDGPHFPPL